MDRTNRAATARRGRVNSGTTRNMYVDGNTVRRLQELPYRQYPPAGLPEQRRRKVKKPASQTARRSREVSREAIRNRQKAMRMGKGFVIFLAVMSVAVLFFCVTFLQLRSDITGRIKNVAALESELSELKEDNDAYESQVTSDVDLNRIKTIAIGRLGMNYPTDAQKKTYTMSNNSYVRQYQDVPDSKR